MVKRNRAAPQHGVYVTDVGKSRIVAFRVLICQ
jgi:hypothetical protein